MSTPTTTQVTQSVDMGMNWQAATEILIRVILDGTRKGKEEAAKELRNMAKVADAAMGRADILQEILLEMDNVGSGQPTMFDATPQGARTRSALQNRIAKLLAL